MPRKDTMEDRDNAEQEPRTKVERLLRENERMQEALLNLKETLSRMLSDGSLPNDDETRELFAGIDREIADEVADRAVLLFNHGTATEIPQPTKRYSPDLAVRYRELCVVCNEAYADADYLYWSARFQQAGLPESPTSLTR